MSKATSFKKNQIVKNRQGWFAKIIEIKNGFVHFAGWFPKKATAEKAEHATSFLNTFGMQRAMGKMEQATTTPEFDGTGEEGSDDDDDGNDNGGNDGDGDGDDTETDPYEGVTVPELKEALKDAELPVSGNRDELVARCAENGIVFESEE
jgi:hypothetical protein